MLVGILSDTHNQRARTRTAVEIFQREGCEALFHCGDFMVPDIVEICSAIPMTFVFGNNDSDMVGYLRSAADEFRATCLGWHGIVHLAGKNIALAHGHMTRDINKVLSQNPDYLLTGHSHIPHDFLAGRTRRINPGALHRANSYTIATLNLETDELRTIGMPNDER
jgi:uncharacterized protein